MYKLYYLLLFPADLLIAQASCAMHDRSLALANIFFLVFSFMSSCESNDVVTTVCNIKIVLLVSIVVMTEDFLLLKNAIRH